MQEEPPITQRSSNETPLGGVASLQLQPSEPDVLVQSAFSAIMTCRPCLQQLKCWIIYLSSASYIAACADMAQALLMLSLPA